MSRRALNLSKEVHIISGGQSRQDSVFKGLKALDRDTKIVFIHDAARPLLSKDLVQRAIASCVKQKAVIAAVPLKPTIKKVNRRSRVVEETLERDSLWEVQTPQVFAKDILLKAHRKFKGQKATDDASLVEQLGVKVKIVMGDYRNIKITTPEDIKIAEALINVK